MSKSRQADRGMIAVALHAEMFRLGTEFGEQLTDEQRRWAEESGFARMQTALGTIAPATFDGRVFDKEHCLEVYREHNERVRQTVSAERLLVFRVEQGWEPLCAALRMPVPDEPFPHENTTSDFKARGH